MPPSSSAPLDRTPTEQFRCRKSRKASELAPGDGASVQPAVLCFDCDPVIDERLGRGLRLYAPSLLR